MKFWVSGYYLTLLGTWGSSLVEAQANVCFMLYQMADNDLEWFLRNDNYELTQSDVVRKESLTTWVYFDHRNYGNGWREDIYEPLQNVFNSDGSTITGDKITNSQYLRWDHPLGKMVVDRTLAGEQDGDHPQTVYDFLFTALSDCVAKGATEYFAAFSSHGGGFTGFGGDENQNRKLTQLNMDLVAGIKAALENVDGTPDKLDVIGFDACLMQALGAADEYQEVAKYILASEAVEPGHGWAYNSLTNANSALDLAKEVVSTFVSEKQGQVHETPKALSVIDSTKYLSFLSNWDFLGAEMENLLTAQDRRFITQVNRARNQAISFEGVTDDIGTKSPSSMDIGSFLKLLQDGCVPKKGSALNTFLENAIVAYDEMFVVRKLGPGTPAGTGMHVLWPVRRTYFGDTDTYDELLFDTSLPFATADAMEWLSFLKAYYVTEKPKTTSSSVCTLGLESEVQAEEGQLLINPTVSDIINDGHKIETEITAKVDSMLLEYGVNLSPQLTERLGHLQGRIAKNGAQRKTTTTRPLLNSRRDRHSRSAETKNKRRRLQSDDQDYLIQFGGDLKGEFNQSKYTSFWERNFFVIEDADGNLEGAYTFDNGGGVKDIPVIYLSESSNVTSADIQNSPLGMSESEFIETFGGEYGFLSFSTVNAVDGAVSNGLTLYTNDGSTYSETPRRAGGKIIPVIYVEGTISGFDFDTLVGGFFSTIIDWNEDASLTIYVTSADSYLNVLELDELIVDVVAFDDDALLAEPNNSEAGVDFAFFSIIDGKVIKYHEDDVDLFIDDDDQPLDGVNSGTSSKATIHVVLLVSVIVLLMPIT